VRVITPGNGTYCITFVLSPPGKELYWTNAPMGEIGTAGNSLPEDHSGKYFHR